MELVAKAFESGTSISKLKLRSVKFNPVSSAINFVSPTRTVPPNEYPIFWLIFTLNPSLLKDVSGDPIKLVGKTGRIWMPKYDGRLLASS